MASNDQYESARRSERFLVGALIVIAMLAAGAALFFSPEITDTAQTVGSAVASSAPLPQ